MKIVIIREKRKLFFERELFFAEFIKYDVIGVLKHQVSRNRKFSQVKFFLRSAQICIWAPKS